MMSHSTVDLVDGALTGAMKDGVRRAEFEGMWGGWGGRGAVSELGVRMGILGGLWRVGRVGGRGRREVAGGEFGVEGVRVEVIALGGLGEPAGWDAGGRGGFSGFGTGERCGRGSAVAAREGVDDGVCVCEDAAVEFENAGGLGGGGVEFGGCDNGDGGDFCWRGLGGWSGCFLKGLFRGFYVLELERFVPLIGEFSRCSWPWGWFLCVLQLQRIIPVVRQFDR